MNGLAAAALDWLAAEGPPNGVFALALLTHPATWSDAALKRLRPLFDRVMPKRGEGSA